MDDDAIEIRPLVQGDEAALVACFQRCYGDTYPADAFHDPEEVAARVAAGRLLPVVAVVPGDGVVGHMALSLRGDGARACEAGNTVVDPRYRGHHLAARLAVALSRRCLETGHVGFHHYPTTAHPVMHKLAVQGGGIEMGVLLDYIPAETHYEGFEAAAGAGRVAVVAVYQPLAAAPDRRVVLPARHEDLIAALYARARIDRRMHFPDALLPDRPSRIRTRFEERRGVLLLEVESLGADLAERVAVEARRRPEAPALVDLPLGDPAVAEATEALEAAGFGFGALLPEYVAAGDVLRLQKRPPALPAPELATERARELLAYLGREGG